MLELDALQHVTDIVCHDNCSDGTMSAILLKDALPDARIQFCQYGVSHDRLQVKPNMLFCDFSPHEAHYQEFADAGAFVLDHHKSVRHIVEAFGERGVFGDEATEPGVSGAVLAYRHVWLSLKRQLWTDYDDVTKTTYGWSHHEVQQLIRREHEMLRAGELSRLVGIRDTWQRHDPDWLTACELGEAIRFFSQDSWLIKEPFAPEQEQWWVSRLSVGQRLVERQLVTLRKVLEGAYRFTSPQGTRVVLFSGIKLTSDACEMVGNEADLVVGFDYVGIEDGEATLVFSTRSHSGFDCAALCKKMGGGGHSAAAGFSVRFDPAAGTADPFSLFQEKLGEYEA